jgi:DNA-binding NarL/FixJ family response regulator
LIDTIATFQVAGLMSANASHSRFFLNIIRLRKPHLPDEKPLSLQEQSITELMTQGLTNKEIAKQLGVSPETVKKHLKNIFQKLGTQTRSELASKYVSMPLKA